MATNGYHHEGANGHSNGCSKPSTEDSASSKSNQVPVAICGMGMRLPGGIHNATDLYDFLTNKGDARSVIGEDRYNVDAYYDPHGKHGTINTKHGYFLSDVDFSMFDLSMFTLTAAEAEQVDPNHRLVLEVVREAFESAGETEWRGKNIGTYVGMFSEDWQELQHKDTLEYNPYRVLGGLDFALPNRVAYEYDLRGPSMIIKTACSMSLQMALSPEGSSKTFDASADGYARGEAVTALYVKRLDEAIRDKNPIRAVIRGSASNADGKTPGLAVPSPDGHEAVIRQAYHNAGLTLSETTMVEAHGTGTKIGDPLETTAIANCFGSQGVYIGAIKPNLGHSEGAAAITSIMKAALSLENKTIIPNIKFTTPNPGIPWKSGNLTVPVEPTPWPANRRERISINSYGIGGSNAHFVIDSAASLNLKAPASSARALAAKKSSKNLLLFSANHPESLKKVAMNIEEYAKDHPGRIEDLAYTLAQRREHLKLRSYCIVQDDTTPFQVSAQFKSQGPRQAAFVFTGQGAQWVHMGRDLMIEYPSFLESIRSMDNVLQDLEHAPPWTMEALQVALVHLLATWEITPSAVVGHSSGEIAAAYAAGALTAKEAIIAAFYRGYVCKTAQRVGGMAAIGMGKTEVEKYLLSGVRVACENSSSSVTISGDLDALEKTMSTIKIQNPEILARKLHVEMAYHSHHMTLVGDTYHSLIAQHVTPAAPRIPFFSSVKSEVLHDASDFGARYWQDNMEKPVLFHSAVKQMLSEAKDCSVHLEVGPHAALSGPLRQIYTESSASINYVSTLIRDTDGVDSFLHAVGQLHSHGVRISYPFASETTRVLTDLPTYPWNYDRSYWAETRIMKNWRFRKHLPHDLLGLQTLEGSDVSPTWRNILRLNDIPWVRDHCIGNDIVFPGAGYIAMAGEAIYQITNVRDYTIRNMELSKAMVLHNDKPIEVVTSLRPQRLTSTLDSEWYQFELVSYDGGAWNKHCSGLVRSGRASPNPPKKAQSLDREVSSSRWYTTMSRVGLNYGPHFTGLKNIRASVVDTMAAANITDKQGDAESSYMIHPSTLDLVFQSLTVASCKGIYRTFTKLFLPTFIGELYIGDAAGKTIQVNTTAIGKPGAVQGSSYGTSDDEVVFYLKAFKGTAMEDSGVEKPPELKSLQLQWKPHFDFVQAGDLMRMQYDIKEQIQHLERLYVLCAIETKYALSGRSTAMPHLEKYRSWLDEQFDRFQQPGYPLVPESAKMAQLSSELRRELIAQLFEICKASGGWAPATAIVRAFEQAVNVYEGRTDYLDLLLQDGVLTGIYSWYNDIWDFKDFMQTLGHTQPQMRILEIGSGTGGLTAKFLEQLKSDYGERLYLKYTFTDISSGFFVQAKERFADYQGIEYKALDISKNPLEQGFTAGEYDLIIASNVLHATPWLHETLANVRTLLQPKGQLFLQELCPITRAMSFIMGQFSGWWLSEEDGRIGSPFISPDEWDRRLRSAGFAGCDSVTLDNEQPYTYNANIIAKPASTPPRPTKITLLRNSEESQLLKDVADILRAKGLEIEHCIWGQQLPPDQDVISFLDLGNKPLMQDLTEEDLTRFLDMIDSLPQATVLWLTPPAQIHAQDPQAAQVLGLARTIRSELAMSFVTLELENTGKGAADAVVQVAQKLQESKEDITELDPVGMLWNLLIINTGYLFFLAVATVF
ncbi:Mycolipanoate synthase [Diaporthe eres]